MSDNFEFIIGSYGFTLASILLYIGYIKIRTRHFKKITVKYNNSSDEKKTT